MITVSFMRISGCLAAMFTLVCCAGMAAYGQAPSTTANRGDVLISQFRLRGPQGPNDEFIEVYNNTDNDILVTDSHPVTCAAQGVIPGPAIKCGWAILDAQGSASSIPRAIITAGSTIPARGFYLLANSGDGGANPGYSLSAYAAPDATYAPPQYGDADFTGLTLFRTADRAQFTDADRLDAVGFDGINAAFRTGNGLTPSNGVSENAEFAFVRKHVKGIPQNTNDNQSDFDLVSTGGENLSGRQSILGAPGPHNTSSPKNNNGVTASFVDPSKSSTSSPNYSYDPTPVTNGNNGTLTLGRTFTNNTGKTITRLRFRIVDITTLGSPAVYSPQADVRALDSSDFVVTVNGQPVTVQGLTVEQPPNQPNGGGLNSSLAVTLANSIPPGGTVSVNFRLGVMASGRYRFILSVEVITS